MRGRTWVKLVKLLMGFPGGPVVGDPLANAGDTGLIPGLGTKIPHAAEQLSHVPQLLRLHSSACERDY